MNTASSGWVAAGVGRSPVHRPSNRAPAEVIERSAAAGACFLLADSPPKGKASGQRAAGSTGTRGGGVQSWLGPVRGGSESGTANGGQPEQA